MLQGRESSSDSVEDFQVDVGNDRGDAVRRLCHHQSPGIDDHASAEAQVVARMRSPLSSSGNPAKVFDGPCAQEQLPVVAAGLQSEGGGHQDNLDPLVRQPAEKLREAEVVAGAHAKGDIPNLKGGQRRAGLNGLGLQIDEPARNLDVEKVDFPVFGDDLSVRIEHHPRVMDSAAVPFQETSQMDVNSVLLGFAANELQTW